MTSPTTSACVCQPGYYGPAGVACYQCPRNSYCTGGVATVCPNGTYTLPGATSGAQCACPANSTLLPRVNCTCLPGFVNVTNSSAPGGWQCNACPPSADGVGTLRRQARGFAPSANRLRRPFAGPSPYPFASP